MPFKFLANRAPKTSNRKRLPRFPDAIHLHDSKTGKTVKIVSEDGVLKVHPAKDQ